MDGAAPIAAPVVCNRVVRQGMTKKEITYIARVARPFFFLMVVMGLLLWFAPQLVTWLPQQMAR